MSDVDSEYVEGDINRVDDPDEFDDDEGNAAYEQHADAAISTAVLEHIATSLAEDPASVSVSTDARGSRVTLSLNVAQQDMGRVIGRRGRTAQAIRALVAAAGAREGLTTSVDIVD